MKELEIWQFAAERLNRNESVMLLVVAESEGSSPGRQGFKMIVACDEMRGSIGGGVMEIMLVSQAKVKSKKVKVKNKSAIVEQIHRKNAPNSPTKTSFQPICCAIRSADPTSNSATIAIPPDASSNVVTALPIFGCSPGSSLAVVGAGEKICRCVRNVKSNPKA